MLLDLLARFDAKMNRVRWTMLTYQPMASYDYKIASSTASDVVVFATHVVVQPWLGEDLQR